jgi:hypothetical protein
MIKITLWLLFTLLASSAPAFAIPANFGVMIVGGNSLSGLGASGGAVLSFLPTSPFGFQLETLLNYLNSASSDGVKITGNAPELMAIADFNYVVKNGKITLGAGPALEWMNSLSCTGAPCPAFSPLTKGAVFEAKFSAPTGGIFSFAQAFFPLDQTRTNFHLEQYTFGAGYLFGAKK